MKFKPPWQASLEQLILHCQDRGEIRMWNSGWHKSWRNLCKSQYTIGEWETKGPRWGHGQREGVHSTPFPSQLSSFQVYRFRGHAMDSDFQCHDHIFSSCSVATSCTLLPSHFQIDWTPATVQKLGSLSPCLFIFVNSTYFSQGCLWILRTSSHALENLHRSELIIGAWLKWKFLWPCATKQGWFECSLQGDQPCGRKAPSICLILSFLTMSSDSFCSGWVSFIVRRWSPQRASNEWTTRTQPKSAWFAFISCFINPQFNN